MANVFRARDGEGPQTLLASHKSAKTSIESRIGLFIWKPFLLFKWCVVEIEMSEPSSALPPSNGCHRGLKRYYVDRCSSVMKPYPLTIASIAATSFHHDCISIIDVLYHSIPHMGYYSHSMQQMKYVDSSLGFIRASMFYRPVSIQS